MYAAATLTIVQGCCIVLLHVVFACMVTAFFCSSNERCGLAKPAIVQPLAVCLSKREHVLQTYELALIHAVLSGSLKHGCACTADPNPYRQS